MILNITYIKKLISNRKIFNFYFNLKMTREIILPQLFTNFVYSYYLGRYTWVFIFNSLN